MAYPAEMKSSARVLREYVELMRSYGFTILEYEQVSPVHMPNSWHYYHLAADINWPGGGQEEFDKIRDIAYPLAKKFGLSVTVGLEGYVENHSGAMFHLHVDVGPWSNIGHGAFLTPWAGDYDYDGGNRVHSDPSPSDIHKGVRKGDRGGAVKRVQRIVGVKDDGVFGDNTARAVRRWKRRHGLPQDSIWGRGCNDTYRRMRHGIRENSKHDVRHVQHIVNVKADGIYGDKTRDAVRHWQRKHDLNDDGIWGRRTERKWVKVHTRNMFPRGNYRLPGGHWYGVDDGTQRSHSGARKRDRNEVRDIQRMVDTKEVDGIYGENTAKEVRNWQRRHSLATDGKVGPRTWGRMVRRANHEF